ncbi:hypothetical protein [Streptomyces sp. NPDC048106]|uniref:hypothetical protein n=1 Tax=Streptomyces sp. NPDC048106 TaxID=3155750 RepID=UPI003453161B
MTRYADCHDVLSDVDGFASDWRRATGAPGRLWYADFDRPHYAQNLGTERRIHLVVDCMPTPELVALFPEEFKNRLPWSEVLSARTAV